MKQIFALILTALLLCGTLTPFVLAAEEPAVSADSIVDTDSGSGADSGISAGTVTPSDATTDGEKTTGTDEISGTPDGTEDSSVSDSFDYTGSVISYITPNILTGTFEMDCGDTGFTQLHSALDSMDISGTAEKDGASYEISLSVTWDFSTVDAQTPGSYTAVGSISIPEGAALSGGLENTVSISVQVTSPVLAVSPSAITLTRFDEPDRTDAVAFAVGTSQKELAEWFADSVAGFTAYDTEGNSYDLISGVWSFNTVDIGTVGVYYASVAPALGTEYMLADGVSLPRQLCAVSIQTPGKPNIDCCVSGRGFLHFPWVLSTEQQEQLDEFAVWLRQNDGEWTSLSDGFWFTSGDFQLTQRILTYGSAYDLKVTYPGGQTGVLTFRYDGELSIIDYSGGDRDGGDVNGGGSGEGSQPAPTPPNDSPNDDNPNSDDSTPIQDNSSSVSNETPAGSVSTPQESWEEQDSSSDKAQPETVSEFQDPGAVSESYSPAQTVISGLRLKDLCADEETVVFGSGNLTVSIPSELLLALNLSDSDTLSIRLTQPESNQILLTVEAAGKYVTELTGTVFRLRYTPQSENVEITVLNEASKPIADTSYDGEFLRFTADTAGVYTILETPKAQEAQKGVLSLLPLSGGLILAAGEITFFRRKRLG